MESLGKFPDSFLAEIAGQPEALRRAADAVPASAAALGRIARAASLAAVPRVVFTGMGASHFADYGPVTRLARSAIGALHVDAAELLHFRMPILGPDVVLVITSQSGGSAEPVAVARSLRARAPEHRPFVVAVTNGPDNELAALADIALDTHAGVEEGPSTVTFAGSLVVLAAVAEAILAGGSGSAGRDADLASDIGATRVRSAAKAAAAAAERVLTQDPAGAAAHVADLFANRPVIVTLGRGAARAASEMGALVLKEAARIPAEALEAAQFRHGPLELAGAALGAFVVATEPETQTLDVRLAEDLAALGAAVTLMTAHEPPGGNGTSRQNAGGDRAPAQSLSRVVLGALDSTLAAAVAVIPMQLLAWRQSVDRGLDPTDLRVASKVTTRE
jgi:glutamine---fructose-6-phosphate transaminase (isomerizing)